MAKEYNPTILLFWQNEAKFTNAFKGPRSNWLKHRRNKGCQGSAPFAGHSCVLQQRISSTAKEKVVGCSGLQPTYTLVLIRSTNSSRSALLHINHRNCGRRCFSFNGTFMSRFRLIAMSEQATTKLIGLSVSAIFLMMLMLRAITS
jgi:hypothetical protein